MNRVERMARLVERVEGSKVSPLQWVLIFFSIVIVRNFLDQFGPQQAVFNFPFFFLHFPLSHLALALALSILLALLARQKIEKATTLMLFAWFGTIIPPLFDLFAAKGGGLIAPVRVDEGGWLHVLLNLFNPVTKLKGTATGVRIGAFLGCILSCVYVFLKTRKSGRTILTLFAVYLCFVFFFTSPHVFITLLSFLTPRFGDAGSVYFESGLFLKSHIDRFAYSIALLDLFLAAVLLVVWIGLYSKEMLISLVKRFVRFEAVHYSLAVSFGAALALISVRPGSTTASFHPYDVLAGAALILSVLCAWWVGRALKNDSSEIPGRYLVGIMFTFALLFAGLVSYSALVFVLVFMGFLHLYYATPLLLHRYFPASTILIALATLSCMMLGFSGLAGVLVPALFPRPVLFAVLVSCTAAFAAKDYVKPGRKGRPGGAFLLFLGLVSMGIILRSNFLIGAGAVLGVAAGSLLVLQIQTRNSLYVIYAAFVSLLAVMSVRGELPLVFGLPIDKEQILHLTRGREYQLDRMYEEAAIELEKSVVAGWEDAETFFALGFSYQQMGDLENSAYWYQKAVSKDTTYVQAYGKLGSVLRALGQFDSSLVVLGRGMEKEPGSRNISRNLYLSLFDLGRFDELIPMLGKHLNLHPTDYEVRQVLADAYVAQRAFESAETEYRKVLGTREGYTPAIVGLGNVMADRGELDEAEKYFLVVLQLDSANADAVSGLGRVYLDCGDYDLAVATFRDAVKLEPLVSGHYERLGDAYMKVRQYREAAAAFQMALALDSTLIHPRKMLQELKTFD